MMKLVKIAVGLGALLASGTFVFGQTAVNYVNTVAEAVSQMRGPGASFTAKAVLALEDKKKGAGTIKFTVAVLEGSLRSEMDVADIDGDAIPASEITQMKSMRKEKVVNIVRPDRNKRYTAYPAMKAYLVTPLDPGQAEAEPVPPKIEKTEMEKEKIDGRACVKNKVVITPARGRKQEFITWNASDLDGFPVRVQYQQGNLLITTTFSDIKLAKPDEDLFKPPRGYMRCTTPMELMGASMRQMK